MYLYNNINIYEKYYIYISKARRYFSYFLLFLRKTTTAILMDSHCSTPCFLSFIKDHFVWVHVQLINKFIFILIWKAEP